MPLGESFLHNDSKSSHIASGLIPLVLYFLHSTLYPSSLLCLQVEQQETIRRWGGRVGVERNISFGSTPESPLINGFE
jgi:hypothetical protein